MTNQARGITHEIVHGTSEPQDFRLYDAGQPLDGTGFTIGIVVKANTTPVAGIFVAWLDQSAGTVRVTGIETLAVGEYRVRFLLTDGSDQVGKVPSGREADYWIVAPE